MCPLPQIPEPDFFRIEEIAKRWGCEEQRVRDLIVCEKLSVSIVVPHNKITTPSLNEIYGTEFPEKLTSYLTIQSDIAASIIKYPSYEGYHSNHFFYQYGGRCLSIKTSGMFIHDKDLIITLEERDRFEKEHEIAPVFENDLAGNKSETRNSEPRDITSKEKGNLLRTIGGLCLLLSDSAPKYKRGEKVNKAAIQAAVETVLKNYGLSTRGQSSSTLSPKLVKAIMLALEGEIPD